MFFKNLFTVNKMEYARGERPDVECILCAVAEKNNITVDLVIHETDLTLISVNLYPYNTGHLMVFPRRHILDLREYTDEEIKEVEYFTRISMDVLDDVYSPSGFNLGYNMGHHSGASIPHIHRHIIPRYINEIGVIDIIGGAKIIVEDPVITKEKLLEKFKNKLS